MCKDDRPLLSVANYISAMTLLIKKPGIIYIEILTEQPSAAGRLLRSVRTSDNQVYAGYLSRPRAMDSA